MDESIEKRIKLAIELMEALKDRRDHINGLNKSIGDSSGDALKSVYEINQDKIREKVELFNRNVMEAKAAYSRITENINTWHAFTGDEREQKRLFFPLKLAKQKRSVKKNIQNCKETINSLIIKNRLIREEVVRLESTLEYEATRRLCADVRYDDYNNHMRQKAFIIDALQYLLPTIPKIPFGEINVDSIEDQAEALAGMLTAE